MKDRTYHEEPLVTLMCEVESMLNNRPLLPCSNDPNDFSVLTPNDFVIKKFDNYAPGDFNESDDSSRKKFRSVQYAGNVFWQRFAKEYITSLNQRTKWLKNRRNFEVGDLVLIYQNNTPRSHWPLGRITRLLPSKDSVVRSVEIKLPNSTVTRPTGTLCLLEKSD